jgi:hypothetical protein
MAPEGQERRTRLRVLMTEGRGIELGGPERFGCQRKGCQLKSCN